MATNTTEPAEVFAVDFAALAREIAMDIFPVETILSLHQLGDEEWAPHPEKPAFPVDARPDAARLEQCG